MSKLEVHGWNNLWLNQAKLRLKQAKLRLKPVATRHQMVTGSLALLNCFFYCFLYSYFNGSRAAAPGGDEVL